MRRLPFLLLTSLMLAGAHASGLTPEVAVDLRLVDDAALSPSGAEIVYRLERVRSPQEPRGSRVGDLWVVDASGGAPTRLPDSGFSPGSAHWSPDGLKLAWIARPDSAARHQVYVRQKLGAVWGEVTAVTRAPGGVSSFQWSPDGSRIAYVAADAESDEILRARETGRDWVVFGESGARSRLYTVDIGTLQGTVVTSAELMVWSFAWSPAGDAFAISASSGTTDDDRCLRAAPYVVPVGGGNPRQIASTQGMTGQVGWSDDGRSIIWLGSIDVTDPRAGSVFTAPATGVGPPRNLTKGFPGTVISAVTLPGHQRTLALIVEEGVQTGMWTLEIDSGRLHKVSSAPEILSRSPAFSRDGKTFSVVASSPRHPEEVFVGRLNGKEALRRLTHSNPELEHLQLGAQEITHWRSADGLTIEGLLIKPVNFVPGTRYPVIVHVHGGSELTSQNGWNAFGSQLSTNLGQLLAARGFVVLYPNYRGSSGRGTDFIRGNRRDIMGREWEDIESGLDHVVAIGLADGARAGIYGFSWGGYAAGWGATRASHRFKAAVAGGGIYNWISEAGTTNTRLHEQYAHWDAPLYENFLPYLERSPIYEVRRAATPILLLHGERDPSCPVSQAIEFHTALKWARVPVELVIYPRQGHYLTERAHQLDFMERSVAWFDRYLAPQD